MLNNEGGSRDPGVGSNASRPSSRKHSTPRPRLAAPSVAARHRPVLERVALVGVICGYGLGLGVPTLDLVVGKLRGTGIVGPGSFHDPERLYESSRTRVWTDLAQFTALAVYNPDNCPQAKAVPPSPTALARRRPQFVVEEEAPIPCPEVHRVRSRYSRHRFLYTTRCRDESDLTSAGDPRVHRVLACTVYRKEPLTIASLLHRTPEPRIWAIETQALLPNICGGDQTTVTGPTPPVPDCLLREGSLVYPPEAMRAYRHYYPDEPTPQERVFTEHTGPG